MQERRGNKTIYKRERTRTRKVMKNPLRAIPNHYELRETSRHNENGSAENGLDEKGTMGEACKTFSPWRATAVIYWAASGSAKAT